MRIRKSKEGRSVSWTLQLYGVNEQVWCQIIGNACRLCSINTSVFLVSTCPDTRYYSFRAYL